MSNRRDFIKQACVSCAAVAGLGFLLAEESCKTADVASITVKNKIVTVPLSQFGDKKTLIIKNPALDFDLALVKKSEQEYVAMKMICPHKYNPVVTTEKGFMCPSHGSEFDTDGNVTRGPASNPMKRFPAKLEGKKVVINLA
jgi:cytochrome b6-f complex iron-sulfur subunit